MYLDESYTMYKLAWHLIEHDKFELVHINENGELWLEKFEGKTSRVARLFHGGFDWKNHMKKDIGQTFQKAKAMKRYFRSKHIEVHNVYIDSHTPIDDWEILKKKMQLNEKNPISMKVYYLSDKDREEELNRFLTAIGGTFEPAEQSADNAEKEEEVNQIREKLTGKIKQKENEIKDIFSYGKPLLTYILLAVNILLFFLLEMNGDSTSPARLIEFGAKYNPAIIEDGEWWRIISSMFLHIGIAHILLNMLAVYYLGTAVERIYGSLRFIVIYFMAGIGGGLASFAFTTNVSAGASGALFGLFGALLFFGCIHRRIFFQTMGMNLLIVIGINIVFGLSVPQVDNGAHMGGLISGFVASAVLYLPKKKNLIIQTAAFIVYSLLIVGLAVYGVQHNESSAEYQLMKAEQLIAEEQYERVIAVVTEGLQLSDGSESDLKSHLLFQRAYSQIRLENTEEAIADLEISVELNSSLAEAHYNLAVLYSDNNDSTNAEEHIEKAYELNPQNEDFHELYEHITGNKPN
ncbi:rhomboid family peptidase. Serine peptidase. MEROPS family S54 [Lentibacillus persicus]|uniref:Rhomboid family peptidase. Serine peptidase. MEROPS family S54 n=1 Tax=Lentibacillus persicus TaxID=640948 RepID=A0A1I1T6H9_9BACI|nr:rhomboid family intramembrane serine protease [Lentibacillus persicus]SFD54202.1 rhomboid family peptidase. Serine peptidase. MEROPS family S54 [Lentibacillus persicus]